MRRRRPLPPDTRPDWRDPNLRVFYSAGGAGLDPEVLQEHCQWSMAQEEEPAFPSWRNDPTYNLRRKP